MGAGDAPCREAVLAVKERGAVVKERSEQATQADLDGALVLCMTRAHAAAAKRLCPGAEAFVFGEWAGTGGEVPDPFGGNLDDYRRTARLLEEMCRAAADRLAGQMVS